MFIRLVIIKQTWCYFVKKILCVYGYACSGSVVVTAYDFESGRPGLNPEWG